ncbi:hypothetical protein SteCoe_36838 [Stentor coeruleus]|uniref:Uncharacterized protein n=1 Tax=Stentor coeruleus TaxID=5963 RepID=A0A1R2AP94_9CILI|nr:hypothetical protein SteCoe_36838 [Stentor coeruleus]
MLSDLDDSGNVIQIPGARIEFASFAILSNITEVAHEMVQDTENANLKKLNVKKVNSCAIFIITLKNMKAQPYDIKYNRVIDGVNINEQFKYKSDNGKGHFYVRLDSNDNPNDHEKIFDAMLLNLSGILAC